MSRKTSPILATAILIAAVLLAALPVAAKAQITNFEAMEFTCGAEPGTEWYTHDETMQHIRGQTLYDIVVSDEPRLSGSAVATVNMNMNLVSGDCVVWGKEVYEVAGGGWMLNYHGRCTDFVYEGGGVARGTGDLEGQLLFMDTWQVFPIPTDNPCPGGVAYNAFTISGYILEN
jgi:hypothetical protein